MKTTPFELYNDQSTLNESSVSETPVSGFPASQQLGNQSSVTNLNCDTVVSENSTTLSYKSGNLKYSVIAAIAIGGALVLVGIGFLIAYIVRSNSISNMSVAEAEVSRADCTFAPNSRVQGTVYIEKQGQEVLISVLLQGNNDGGHGFSIYAVDNLKDGCKNTLSHFNPFGKNHGAPQDADRHVGDLGNIDFNGGLANINITDTQVKLIGNTSVIGHAIVIHEREDDLGRGTSSNSKTTGNAGNQLACCIIGIVKTN